MKKSARSIRIAKKLVDLPQVNYIGQDNFGKDVVKKAISLRMDTDVLAFFKSTGRLWQSRINAALRKYMEQHKE